MAEIKRLKELMNKLDKRIASLIHDQDVSAVIGYTAAYALQLHENVEMKWRGLPRDRSVRYGDGRIVYTGYTPLRGRHGLFWGPTGRAKFLEEPARRLNNDGTFVSIIVQILRAGKSIGLALLTAGLRLQRESMILVPVDTGNLRASAFCRLERKGVTEQEYLGDSQETDNTVGA